MTLRDIDLNLLHVFSTIYSTGNISHAAKQLNMSQPAISNALARLREQLQDPLFVRSGNGVVPTPKADALVVTVREALTLLKSSFGDEVEEFTCSSQRRHFRIVDTIESIAVDRLVEAVRERKNTSVEILPYYGTDIYAGLSNGTIDLACHIYTPPDDELNFSKVYEVDCYAVTRANHPEIHGKLDMETYSRLDQLALVPSMRVQTHVEEQLKARNVDRSIVCAVTEFQRMPEILAETDLIAILPRHTAIRARERYAIDLHEVPFILPKRNFYLIWRRNRDDDAGLNWLKQKIAGIILEEQESLDEAPGIAWG